uniref:Putative secreted protein n=1 Tax=Panstrongylus lignarius TaxID=156445 RepID=A0A224Y540_9HEMI
MNSQSFGSHLIFLLLISDVISSSPNSSSYSIVTVFFLPIGNEGFCDDVRFSLQFKLSLFFSDDSTFVV